MCSTVLRRATGASDHSTRSLLKNAVSASVLTPHAARGGRISTADRRAAPPSGGGRLRPAVRPE